MTDKVTGWLRQNRKGLAIGAVIGAVVGLVNVVTGSSFMLFAFPGVFFGGFFIGGNLGRAFMPDWALVLGVAVNIVFFGIVGAWIESLVRRK